MIVDTEKLRNLFLELGYTEEDYLKIISAYPIYILKEETLIKNVKTIFEFLSKIYSKEEVIKITKKSPSIYSYSIENMKQKIDDICSLGYSKEEVIKMTKTFPAIYGSSIENMEQKIKFYDSINMHELAIVDSKELMQSVNLSYARYMFYKERGTIVDMSNYRKLFIVNKQFEKSYGITKKELLEKYDYEKYLEEQKNIGGLK